MVAGALANKPGNGGEAWVRLSWVLGLRRLGFDVHLVEEISPSVCLDAHGRPAAVEDSVNLAYFASVTAAFGLSATLLCAGRWVAGLSMSELVAHAASCDVILNISGHLEDVQLLSAARCRVFLDIDPGFTQVWAADRRRGARLAGHDVFATIGERIGSAACNIPVAGVQWISTRQPVLLDQWPVAGTGWEREFSTVARWRAAYGAVSVGQQTQTLKHQEFRRVFDLPRLANHGFELALDIDAADAADKAALQGHGWRVVDASDVAAAPETYRSYIQASAAEFSACHGVYAHTRSGWVSDRTARYLASGRPAVVEDTAPVIPTGAGMLTWSTLDEARAAVDAVMRDYDAHAAAARQLAERYFNSDAVLDELLDRCSVPA